MSHLISFDLMRVDFMSFIYPQQFSSIIAAEVEAAKINWKLRMEQEYWETPSALQTPYKHKAAEDTHWRNWKSVVLNTGEGIPLQYSCLENPWTEEPGRLQSMGSLRVGHDWATSLSLFTFMHWRRKWQPTPVFLPGESQGRRSLVSCCLWGHTESDTTKVT